MTRAPSCATPALTNGMTLTTANSFGAPAIAWGETQGAIVYSEVTDAGYAISLARFSASAAAVGNPVPLAITMTAGYPGPNLAVASDGSTYLACWDGATSATGGVACATVPAGLGSATLAAHTDTGSSPSLTYTSPTGYLLADIVSGSLNVESLSNEGSANTSLYSAASSTLPLIAAFSDPSSLISQWVVSSVNASGALVDTDFSTTTNTPISEGIFSSSPNLDQGYPYALSTGLGATAAVWYDANGTGGVYSAVIGGGAPVLISGTGSSYGRVAVAGGNASFAATWSDQGGSIMYVPLDGTGTPTGSATSALSVNWDDNPHALTAVTGGFMLVSTVGTPFTSLQLVLIGCP